MRSAVLAMVAAVWLTAVPLAVAADPAGMRWDGGIFSYNTSANCYANTVSGIVDPIGAVFHGSAATYNGLGDYPNPSGGPAPNHIGKHTGWHYVGGKQGQYYQSQGSCNINPSDHNMGAQKSGKLDYHARFWDQVSPVGEHRRLVATPHMDEHDKGACSGDHVPKHMKLPNGGTGSGFDYARQRLRNAFARAQNPAHDHHVVRTEYWGNGRPVVQCKTSAKHYLAQSDGHVVIIRVGRP